MFQSFLSASLIDKAQKAGILEFHLVNPRDWTDDKHQQVDDVVYGWWAGMLIKAQPVIDAVENVVNLIKKRDKKQTFKIVFPSPSRETFTQKVAYWLSKVDNLIFVCGRYEGIDYRFEEYMIGKYGSDFCKTSLWKFVLLGWEVAVMAMVEAVCRLVPWVIKESQSWQDESYNIKQWMQNLEFPQYTRPEMVYDLSVPEVLLSWNKQEIQEWKKNNEKSLDF